VPRSSAETISPRPEHPRPSFPAYDSKDQQWGSLAPSEFEPCQGRTAAEFPLVTLGLQCATNRGAKGSTYKSPARRAATPPLLLSLQTLRRVRPPPRTNLPCAICVGPGHTAVRLDPSSESCCNLPAFVLHNATHKRAANLPLDRAVSQQENNFGTKNFGTRTEIRGQDFPDTHRNSRAPRVVCSQFASLPSGFVVDPCRLIRGRGFAGGGDVRALPRGL
jgi:hypothetical protein